jgi:hypothetical protein
MRILGLILIWTVTVIAQPMAYNRLPNDLANSSSRLIANTTFDTGDLPANSGWTGEFKLFVRCSGRQIAYLDGAGEEPVPASDAGMVVAFSYPAGSTVTLEVEHFLSVGGYFGANQATSTVVFVLDSSKAVQSSKDSTFFWADSYPPGRLLPYLDSLAIWGHEITVMTNWDYSVGTEGAPWTLKKKVNYYTLTDLDESGLGIFPSGYSRLWLQMLQNIGVGNADVRDLIRIKFRIDVGSTSGHLQLHWSTMTINDLWSSPPYDPPVYGLDYDGVPAYITFVLRGSTLTAFKLY